MIINECTNFQHFTAFLLPGIFSLHHLSFIHVYLLRLKLKIFVALSLTHKLQKSPSSDKNFSALIGRLW